MAQVMNWVFNEDDFDIKEGILHHEEGVDLMPSNIELSGVETSIVGRIGAESILKDYIELLEDRYEYVVVDCSPNLGQLTINALVAADEVIIPVQAAYLRANGLEVNVGKHISVETDDMVRAMRTNQLGENYTTKAIIHRLATKQNPLIWHSVGEHSHYLSKRELVNFTPTKMKKYKDMTSEEKQKALRLIRLSRLVLSEIVSQG